MKKSLGPNTLVYPTPVWVIGTYDQNGKANVMTAAWVGICCSNPPLYCRFLTGGNLHPWLHHCPRGVYRQCGS
jgi:hypothetical protein